MKIILTLMIALGAALAAACFMLDLPILAAINIAFSVVNAITLSKQP